MAKKPGKTDQAGKASKPDVDGAAKGGKGKLIVIVVAGLLAIAGAGGGLYFTGMLDGLLGTDDPQAEADPQAHPTGAVFYELPDLVVSLNSGDRKTRFLKVRINLELADAHDIPLVERLMPRVMDQLQVYLRELRMEDLKGSAGTARLREELLKRIGVVTAPARIVDVLFLELFVQ